MIRNNLLPLSSAEDPNVQFRNALRNDDDFTAMNFLTSITPGELTHDECIRALKLSIQLSETEVMNRFLDIPEVAAHVVDDNNYALRTAIIYNHLAVANRLLDIPAVVALAHAENNQALMRAIFWGQLGIVNRLLDIPAVVALAHAENNRDLRYAAEIGHIAIVNRLLEIPAVLANVTALNNGALRIAQERNHPEIIARLNQIQAVREYVEPVIIDENITLGGMATNRESAMGRLSNEETAAIVQLKERYAIEYAEQGQDKILENLYNYLKARYEAVPAQYDNQTLPLEYNDTLTIEAQQMLLLNPYHSAWRYFQQPNPWLHPSAQFVVRIEGSGQGYADIKPEHKELIANLWLACNHASTADMPDGYTNDSLKELLVTTLAGMNRGHNWDNTRKRIVKKVGVDIEINEEYDDLEKDKPTCQFGAKKPLATFLELLFKPTQPEERSLTQQIIMDKFKAAFISRNVFKNSLMDYMLDLDFFDLKRLEEALVALAMEAGDFAELSEAQKSTLAPLKIDRQPLENFIAQSKAHFGEKRISMPFTDVDLTTKHESYEQYISTQLGEKWFSLALGNDFLDLIKIQLQMLTQQGVTLKENKQEKESKKSAETSASAHFVSLIFSDPLQKSKGKRKKSCGETLPSFQKDFGSFVNGDKHRRSHRLAKRKTSSVDVGMKTPNELHAKNRKRL